MNKCTTILLTLSLLIYGDSFAMSQKKVKGKKPTEVQTAVWPSPAEASTVTRKATSSTSDAGVDLKSQFEHTQKLGQVLTGIPTACATLKQTDIQTSPHAKLQPVLTAINNLHDSRRMGTGLHVAQAQARALSHPKDYKKLVVPNITENARALLRPVAAPALPQESVTVAAPTDDQDENMSDLFAQISDIATGHSEVAPVIPTAEELTAAIGYNNDDTPPAPMSPSPVADVAQQQGEIATTEVVAAPASQEAATVTTDVVSTVENAPAPVATQVAPKAASKSSYITAMMKFACVRSTNLAKALYFLQNTANRDDLTRKEIGSRLGDAIPETIAALKQIHSMCYGKSEIQSSDETTRLQQPLVNDLEAALNLAIAPTDGEKQIQVDTSMLKMAVDELQRLNRHQKHQAKRVIVKATQLAQKNKSLAFLVKANMESRGDHALDDALSDDEYTTPDDMLLIVHNETHVDAEDTK